MSMPEVVKEIITRNRSIYDCMKMDLINYTALAVKIQPEIERILGNSVNLNTVVVAIKRYADTFEIKEKIGIRVERINGDVNEVSTTQISIVSLSEAFRETGSNTTPDYRVERRQIGGYEIQLASSYIERANQVVKVVFNNRITPKEILYAPLYTLASQTDSITVSAKSHYVLKTLFNSIETPSELALLLPCTGSVTKCSHQP